MLENFSFFASIKKCKNCLLRASQIKYVSLNITQLWKFHVKFIMKSLITFIFLSSLRRWKKNWLNFYLQFCFCELLFMYKEKQLMTYWEAEGRIVSKISVYAISKYKYTKAFLEAVVNSISKLKEIEMCRKVALSPNLPNWHIIKMRFHTVPSRRKWVSRERDGARKKNVRWLVVLISLMLPYFTLFNFFCWSRNIKFWPFFMPTPVAK